MLSIKDDMARSDNENDDLVNRSRELQQQRAMCDEGMGLVNQGVAMQNANPPDVVGAETTLLHAVNIMEKALSIQYGTSEEQEASQRLNNKMNRYVKMIRGQLERGSVALGGAGGGGGGRHVVKFNILEMDRLPAMYNPIVEMLNK